LSSKSLLLCSVIELTVSKKHVIVEIEFDFVLDHRKLDLTLHIHFIFQACACIGCIGQIGAVIHFFLEQDCAL